MSGCEVLTSGLHNLFLLLTACHTASSDYISVVCDLWDSEELKIESEYSSSLKATVEKICSERSEIFEQCFEEVKEGIERVRAINAIESREQPYF